MSFLAPLYALGILAVTAPIIFHLICRTPRGRVPFSSLMFLTESPPQVTRRSRLDNLWLLFLRAAAICLLAMAFARPFFRSVEQKLTVTEPGARVVLLIDNSASMRRGDLWAAALEQVRAEFAELSDNDTPALIAFDHQVHPLLTFGDFNNVMPAERENLLNEKLKSLQPSWRATHLDTALAAAADMLTETNQDNEEASGGELRIVLVSDLQQGGRLSGIQSQEWAENLRIKLRSVAPETSTNAGLQIVAAAESEAEQTEVNELRVRIENAADSETDQFQLAWNDSTETTAVQVPPGQSRIVKLPAQDGGGEISQIKLIGDDQPFDNVAFRVPPQPREMTVWYLSDESPDDPQQPRYYVDLAFSDTPFRKIKIISPTTGELPEDLSKISMALLTAEPTREQAEILDRYLKEGGTALFVPRNSDDVAAVSSLTGIQQVSATEVETNGYAMWENIRFDHPLFASFSEARFSDFTQIHFWKHRRVDETSLENATVLARFDDGSAAVIEVRSGPGKLYLFTSGWHPEDSQLARSSKFAPLLNALLDGSDRSPIQGTDYRVGDEVICSIADSTAGGTTLIAPGAEPVPLTLDDEPITDATDRPGLYEFRHGDQIEKFAVNLDPQESRTTPYNVDHLEQLGLPIRAEKTAAEKTYAAKQQKQLQSQELESQQKIWQWLALAAAAVLILETWWAARPPKSKPQTS